jgi:hypothetical protein
VSPSRSESVIQGIFLNASPLSAHPERQRVDRSESARQLVTSAQQRTSLPSQALRVPTPSAANTGQRTAIGTVTPLPRNLQLDNRGGQPLPAAVRQKMESVFRTTFSDVRIHVGHHATAMGAVALTQGTHIHFAPGQYDPSTPRGEQVLGHELAHVVQQRAGRVTNPFRDGVAVVQDRSLDAEAQRMARMVSVPGARADIVQTFSLFGVRITGGTVTVPPHYTAFHAGVIDVADG